MSAYDNDNGEVLSEEEKEEDVEGGRPEDEGANPVNDMSAAGREQESSCSEFGWTALTSFSATFFPFAAGHPYGVFLSHTIAFTDMICRMRNGAGQVRNDVRGVAYLFGVCVGICAAGIAEYIKQEYRSDNTLAP